MSAAPLPPHPTLGRYYSRGEERPGFVNELFDGSAPYYEWVCRVMSLGSGEKYRREALREAGLEGGMRVLDVATGTGLVLRPAANITGAKGRAVGLDPSRGMLSECRKVCAAPIVQGRAEDLPFPVGSFDMVSMGYGLRHVADLHTAFSEYFRVLRPGGRVLLLEITKPRRPLGRWLNRLYLRTVVPGVARFGTNAEAVRRLMDYFWETIESCVPPEVILQALRESGFARAIRRVKGGVLSEYVATRAL